MTGISGDTTNKAKHAITRSKLRLVKEIERCVVKCEFIVASLNINFGPAVLRFTCKVTQTTDEIGKMARY
jgi:hypothetical protein